MGKVYSRLVLGTLQEGENFSDGIIRVYNNPLCEIVDDYNSSALTMSLLMFWSEVLG